MVKSSGLSDCSPSTSGAWAGRQQLRHELHGVKVATRSVAAVRKSTTVGPAVCTLAVEDLSEPAGKIECSIHF